MQAYILLDRSGSMQSLWVEALSSVNAFAKELANKTDGPAVDSHVTLAVFDGQEGLQFDVLRSKQPALHWENVTDKDASPRGMTPLLDAMVRIIALAEADNPRQGRHRRDDGWTGERLEGSDARGREGRA